MSGHLTVFHNTIDLQVYNGHDFVFFVCCAAAGVPVQVIGECGPVRRICAISAATASLVFLYSAASLVGVK